MFIEAGCRYCLGATSKSTNFVVVVVCMKVIMIGTTAGMVSVGISINIHEWGADVHRGGLESDLPICQSSFH